jgi:carbon storage regulator
MLILSRKLGESIVIDGRITVKIVRLAGDVIKLGITAPPEVPVHRQEVYDEIQTNNVEALTDKQSPLPRLNPNGPPAPSALSGVPAAPRINSPATQR